MANKKIRVLHFSSRYEECGVAKYLEQYIRAMSEMPEIENEYFGVSPYQTPAMSPSDIQKMADQLKTELKDYDILHIQHEFSLYAHNSFRKIVEAGKASGKKVVITVHASPSLIIKDVHLHGIGPRSVMHYLREKRRQRQLIALHVEPFKMADLVLAHNEFTIESLKHIGVQPDHIKRIIFPVQVFGEPPKSEIIAKELHKKQGDVIYATIGFLHRYKGLFDAVKALEFLPDHYKLAIVGGMKEDSDDIELYDKLCDLMNTLNVRDRVYITGYIDSDDDLNALIRECDVCVYPYDRVYYSNVSSSSLSLAFANSMPVITYPTATFKEMSKISDGATVLCATFAYYELARELRRLDLVKQRKLSEAYAKKAAWPKSSRQLVMVYEEVLSA